MTRDELVFGGLVLSFALFVTAHVALCLAIATRAPRGRAIIALVFLPAAPIWGARDGHTKRVGLWIAFAASYGVMLVLASR